jgi:hypothetical protein
VYTYTTETGVELRRKMGKKKRSVEDDWPTPTPERQWLVPSGWCADQIHDKEMSWNRPEWYMTTQEFADLVVRSLEVTNHFNKDERVHPEDIVAAFVTAAETIAIGAGAAGKKVWAAEKKQEEKRAVMEAGNLRKAALPQDDEIAPYTESQDDFLGYSEWRHRS